MSTLRNETDWEMLELNQAMQSLHYRGDVVVYTVARIIVAVLTLLHRRVAALEDAQKPGAKDD